MHLDIISPEKNIFTGEIKSINLPGTQGRFGILNNHAPIISTLTQGTVIVTDEKGGTKEFDIKGGVVEVLKNKVIVLAE